MGELLVFFEFKDQSIQYVVFGVNYYKNNWLVKFELVYFNIDWGLVGDLGYGYISVGYEFEQFILYVIFVMFDLFYDCYIIEEFRYDLINDLVM